MEILQNRDIEYVMDDYYDMRERDIELSNRNRPTEDDDFTRTDDVDMEKPKWDTSSVEARNGKDIQGIPWERLRYGRDKYREMRLKEYINYENFSLSHEQLEKVCHHVEKGSMFYDFQFNTRLVKPTIFHFQLRNLLWATSKHDVYLKHNFSIMHWSSLSRNCKEVLNVAKPVVAAQNHLGLCSQTVSRVQISSMAVKDNVMVVGGFYGELICKHLNKTGVAFCTKPSTEDNAITNCVDVYHDPKGCLMVMSANNDARVRIFDAHNFTCVNQHPFPWPVNNVTASPDGKLLAVLGDSTECVVADSASGKVLERLRGHYDYSFASAWHPEGRIVATGSQDKTCRLWDVRKLSRSFAVLEGRMGAIRALRFTSDGRFMAMSEPADFVHVLDAVGDYSRVQEIDLFGEISGISFSPDNEVLFVGVADRTYGSLLELRRRRCNRYLDAFF